MRRRTVIYELYSKELLERLLGSTFELFNFFFTPFIFIFVHVRTLYSLSSTLLWTPILTFNARMCYIHVVWHAHCRACSRLFVYMYMYTVDWCYVMDSSAVAIPRIQYNTVQCSKYSTIQYDTSSRSGKRQLNALCPALVGRRRGGGPVPQYCASACVVSATTVAPMQV